ncbi:YRB1, partial [Symbiodinium microadriaticum]
EESTAVFTPVVHLEAVEVKTHEEDEEILFVKRAKLYQYSESLLNKGTGTKTWNERGTGEMKILKHKETSHIRALMRQEKTMKVIANHVLDYRIVIVPNAGASDRSWVWTAFDFADGELVEKTFAVKFGDAAGANEFKEIFTKGQADMKVVMTGADAANGSAEADAAAAAIEALDVKAGEATAVESADK